MMDMDIYTIIFVALGVFLFMCLAFRLLVCLCKSIRDAMRD